MNHHISLIIWTPVVWTTGQTELNNKNSLLLRLRVAGEIVINVKFVCVCRAQSSFLGEPVETFSCFMT